MIKRCKHEYVNTGDFLPKEIGPCCKKCGKPLVKHEHFTYKWRLKKAFKTMLSGWREFANVDYSEIYWSAMTVVAGVVLILSILLAPFLSVFIAPFLAMIRWARVNKSLKKRVIDRLSAHESCSYDSHREMKDD